MSDLDAIKREFEQKFAELERKGAANGAVKADERTEALIFENKKLINERARLHEKIEALQKQLRNAHREQLMHRRREELYLRYAEMVSSAIYDLLKEIDGPTAVNTFEPDPTDSQAIAKARSLLLPSPKMPWIDYFSQLQKWSRDDAEFSEKLAKMGFEPFEDVVLTLAEENADSEAE